jgi:hypothetical protein
MKNNDSLKVSCGIDTLYYFSESNEKYDDLYLEILDQMEKTKEIFANREIEYQYRDIHITLNEMSFEFLGKNEGFYWFRDINEYFKIGFKDTLINTGLHDIRVQLQAEGIYTLGLPTLLTVINKTLLGEYTTGKNPITRIDLNCFVQYDLSFVNKEMFVSRKRNYSQITEIGSSKRTQTIYVGKPPFRLRLYDKKLEMQQSKKQILMEEYFINQGFDLEEELFNVEFEMHRKHLRDHNIETLEDALTNSQSLFKKAMDDIRLIDIKTINEKDIKNNTKNRAKTLLIWDEIKDSYSIEAFMQNVFPVERAKRKIVLYDDEKFKEQFFQLIRKAYVHRVYLSTKLIEDYLQQAIESTLPPRPKKETEAKYIEIEQEKDGKVEKYRLFDDGQLIKPITIRSAKRMGNYELQCHLEELAQNKMTSAKELKQYQIAYDEAYRRGLVPKMPF